MSNDRPIVILDTDVVSYMLNGTTVGVEYGMLLRGYRPSISFITAAELRFGVEKRNWGTRRQMRLDMFLQDFLVLPPEEGMDRVYAKVMVERERAGRRLEKADGWIATTAIYYDLPLAAHDGDFVGTPGLRLITASAEVRAAQLKLPVVRARPLNLDATCRCGV